MKAAAIITAGGLALAGAALAQDAAPFGQEEDVTYAAQLWDDMVEADLAGEGAVQSFPYPGTDPHGMMLETFYASATVEGHTGALIVKRNYGPEGVTVDQVLGAPSEHLGAVTVMFQREDGYDPETNNWFWAKYLPDGTLDRNPNDMALAGLVGKGADAGCIACHQGAGGEDYLFTTDADLAVAE
ncbi:cytochrome P460 family protein [Tranquillimonas alkanivorans]|uniref:Cytochrome P460 n=1 Tax=Tranquillimonas alkanivorans TaxID=441119 RepID=A0A1I5U0D7_9RHOB|nr:cytochrome P460 family protein [Tranquillimonas alkanivorans]SFP88317.1 Cytochrome P460 [Tranquillimonas alkanivorans]